MAAAVVILTLTGCAGGPADDAGGGDAATMETCGPELTICPAESFHGCPTWATPTPPCCSGGFVSNACEVPAGTLTRECPESCAKGLCAVNGPNGSGPVCCTSGALAPVPGDPCLSP